MSCLNVLACVVAGTRSGFPKQISMLPDTRFLSSSARVDIIVIKTNYYRNLELYLLFTAEKYFLIRFSFEVLSFYTMSVTLVPGFHFSTLNY